MAAEGGSRGRGKRGMIEFRGKYSRESEDLLVRMQTISTLIKTVPVCAVCIAVVVVLAVLLELPVMFTFLIPPVVVILFAAIAPSVDRDKVMEKLLTVRVVIDEYGGIDARWKSFSQHTSPDDVKKVVEKKGCYYITFKGKQRDVFLDKAGLFRGDLDEFARIFQNSLIVKRH